jgi:hypothetical protein
VSKFAPNVNGHENRGNFPTLSAFRDFLCASYARVLSISAAVLIPCFWHKHIQACDLASHVYNAWLSTLVERGEAPGLYIVSQWNNILFDVLLARLGAFLGFAAAEKIAVSLLVLIFFWGAFALIAAATRRAPWFLAPLIGMVAYGWTFQIGFSNYYLSLGIAFWGIAFFWRVTGGWEFLIGLIFFPLAFMAHPIGLAWLTAVVAYIYLSSAFPSWWKLLFPIAAVLILFAIHAYLGSRYSVQWTPPRFFLNGIDQLILGLRYGTLAKSILYFSATCFFLDCILRRKELTFWKEVLLPLSLYGISLAAILLLPDAVSLPQYSIPVGFLTMRLTSICAVLALVVLGCMQPRFWHAAAFTIAAALFFAFLWQDTAKIESIELQAERLVRQLPQYQRVAATIWPLPGTRFYFINHIVDRACIGRCFSYSNYEPGSRQFRVRALPGSPIAVSSALASDEMQSGTYIVQPSDLPMYQIYQCSPILSDLCIRQLQAGEPNGRLGFLPSR